MDILIEEENYLALLKAPIGWDHSDSEGRVGAGSSNGSSA